MTGVGTAVANPQYTATCIPVRDLPIILGKVLPDVPGVPRRP